MTPEDHSHDVREEYGGGDTVADSPEGMVGCADEQSEPDEIVDVSAQHEREQRSEGQGGKGGQEGTGERKVGLRRQLRRWASSNRDEAIELRASSVKAGCVSIGDAPDREQVTLHGTLRTVTLRPRGGVPALEAELYDGSGTVTVLWLGRRRISGIYPGRALRVSGRIGVHASDRIMYNPRYELRDGA